MGEAARFNYLSVSRNLFVTLPETVLIPDALQAC